MLTFKMTKYSVAARSIRCVLAVLTGVCVSAGQLSEASAGALGNLETPIVSLGALTSLPENLQKGISSPIGTLIDENDCQRKIVMPEEQPPLVAGEMQVPKFTVEISGPGCPVTYMAELTGIQEPMGFTAQFKFKYAAQSAEAKALYDIDATEFVGELRAVGLQSPTGGGIEFSFKYDGKGNSQSMGPFSSLNQMNGKVAISMGGAMGPRSGSGMPFNLKIEGGFEDLLRFDFKNESAELKSSTVFSGFAPQAVYTVNGKNVPEAEYKTIRDLVKLPGVGDIGLGEEESTLECKAEVTRAGMSVPMASSRSCGGFKKEEMDVDGLKMIFDFNSDPNYTSIRVDVCPAGAACGMSERAFLPDETATYVDQLLGTYTVTTTCAVVPVCTP